jgi:hypothetical protein
MVLFRTNAAATIDAQGGMFVSPFAARHSWYRFQEGDSSYPSGQSGTLPAAAPSPEEVNELSRFVPACAANSPARVAKMTALAPRSRKAPLAALPRKWLENKAFSADFRRFAALAQPLLFARQQSKAFINQFIKHTNNQESS